MTYYLPRTTTDVQTENLDLSPSARPTFQKSYDMIRLNQKSCNMFHSVWHDPELQAMGVVDDVFSLKNDNRRASRKLGPAPFSAACFFAVLAALVLAGAGPARAASLAALEQQAFHAAVQSVADSVVQIRTVGGLEQVGQVLMTGGPSTGLIVSEDGYIVSSAFNFAQQPTSILVRLPDGQLTPARLVARDRSRMLVLLKVEARQPLPTAQPAPPDSIQVGQWAIAVGRTFRADQVDVSVGIVSALRRMYGRALQTDANISAANYGGPLLDLGGRVLGVLVPMSPQSQGNAAHGPAGSNEVAGVEFYDSGIGFAVPLTDILARLDRWKQGVDQEPGLLGIGLVAGAPFAAAPVIATVWPKSPAAAAGWKPDDRIVAVDGIGVETQAQLRAQIVPRYAGQQVRITIQRGDQRLEHRLTLTAKLEVFRHAMLGILPARGPATAKGIAIRTVLPDSPAARAGLRAGDRLLKISGAKVATPAAAQTVLNKHHPEEEVSVTIARGPSEKAAQAGEPGTPDERAQGGSKEKTMPVRLATLSADLYSRADLDRSNPARADLAPGRNDASSHVAALLPKENPKVGSENNPVEHAAQGPHADSQAAPAPGQSQDTGSQENAPQENVPQALGNEPSAWQLKSFKLPEFPQQAQLLRPKKLAPNRRYPILIWLADQPKQTQAAVAAWRPYCQRDGLLLLLPQPEDSLGWSAGDLRYLSQLVRTAQGRLQGDPLRLAVAGRGKGGQLACLLGLRHRVPAVITIDTPLPRTVTLTDNQPGQRLMFLTMQSQQGPLLPLLRKDRARLQIAGYPAARWELRAGSGQLDPRDRDAMARWIDMLDRL